MFDGARIIAVAPDGSSTLTTYPLYADMVIAMRGRSGVEFGRELMTRMGGRPTGETGSFAGQACEYWEIAQSRTCVTPWGGSLHVRASVAGLVIERTATEVRLGDGGPDEAFADDPARVREGPDLGEIMKKL